MSRNRQNEQLYKSRSIGGLLLLRGSGSLDGLETEGRIGTCPFGICLDIFAVILQVRPNTILVDGIISWFAIVSYSVTFRDEKPVVI